MFIEQKRVVRLTGGELGHAVGQQTVQPDRGGRPAHEEFPHVGNVENPALLAHDAVFLQNARVLHRHFPTGEVDHAATGGHVLVIKRGAQAHDSFFWSSKFK